MVRSHARASGSNPGRCFFTRTIINLYSSQNDAKSGVRSQLLSLGGVWSCALSRRDGEEEAFFYYLNMRLLD